MDSDLRKTFHLAVGMVKRGYPIDAIPYLEKNLVTGGRSAICLSWLGIAIARAGGDLARSESLCLEAIKKEFYRPRNYLCLAEVYIKGNKKAKAISVLKRGLRVDAGNPDIFRMLNKLGIRRESLLPFLSRSNFMNKYGGKLIATPR